MIKMAPVKAALNTIISTGDTLIDQRIPGLFHIIALFHTIQYRLL